jgi:translation initiation factor IF-1
MPKQPNMKKSAAALYQNQKAIEQARKKSATFGAVIKSLGNGGFEIALAGGKSAQATPRGLFGKGPMMIGVGHVVIVEGAMGKRMEIVARLDQRSQIAELIDEGHMPAEILRLAKGTEQSAQAVVEDDIFEVEGEEAFWGADIKGGLKGARKAEETKHAIAARVAGLQRGRGMRLDGSVGAGSALAVKQGGAAAVLSVLTMDDMTAEQKAEFVRWRAARPVVRVAAPAAPRVSLEHVEEQQRLAAESAAAAAAAHAAEEAAAHAAELREFLAQRTVAENWDDEAVNIEDL